MTGLAAAALASTPSCADNHKSIFIYGVVALTAPDCTAKADAGSKLLAFGEMELKLTDTYGNFLLVGNQLIARGSPSNLRAEPNRVQVTGAEIQLRGPDGNDLTNTLKGWTGPTSYSVLANGMVSPTVSADPNYAPVFLQIIPPGVGQVLRTQLAAGASLSLVADIKVFGQTLGLNDVETGIFTFTINVTNGGSFVQTYNVAGNPDCSVIPTDVTFAQSCFAGQDVGAYPCYYLCRVDPTATGC